MTYICLSCKAVYDPIQRDGTTHGHVCPPDRVTTPATFDATGTTLVTPEVRTPIANPRNENVRPDLMYIEGKPYLVTRDPNDSTRRIEKPADTFIIAEGLGRALYVEGQATPGPALPLPTKPGT